MPCHYQSTGKTEEGEAVEKVGNEVKRDSSGTNSLATEGSEINTRSPETSTVNCTVTLQCSGSDCLNENPPGTSELVHNQSTCIIVWMGLSCGLVGFLERNMLTLVDTAKVGLCLVTTLDGSRLCLAMHLEGKKLQKLYISSLLSRSL